MIILTISLLGRGTPLAYHEVLVARAHENIPAVPRNNSPVAQHGAGAKKCWGPAPLKIINILKVRSLSFSDGAGNPEKFAPAPSRDLACSYQLYHEMPFYRHGTNKTALPCNETPFQGDGLRNNMLPAPAQFLIAYQRHITFSLGSCR